MYFLTDDEEIDNSSSVIVTHYLGLTVDESQQLRKEMRNNGAKFKVTKNRLTKLALQQTQFKDISDFMIRYNEMLTNHGNDFQHGEKDSRLNYTGRFNG